MTTEIEREAILRAAAAALPSCNLEIWVDWTEGCSVCLDAEDILAIWSAARAQEAERLRAEVEALRRDAERYRWLRNADLDAPLRLCSRDRRTSYHNSEIDEAVDAALKEHPNGR